MNDAKALLMLYATTFLHPGAGSTTGIVDLPVQREVHTSYPFIAATGLKGSLREKAEAMIESNVDASNVDAIFGPEKVDTNAFAGCLALGDARLLAMPIRSIPRTFVWATCPLILDRFARDAVMAGLCPPPIQGEPADNKAWAPGEIRRDRLVLEDLDVTLESNPELEKLATYLVESILPSGMGRHYLDKFRKDLIIVRNRDFDHLVRFGTQISARIALNARKTTAGDGGNLWYEETIPPETVFYSMLHAVKPRVGNLADPEQVMRIVGGTYLQDGLLRVGGNETVGQGWCLARLAEGVA